MCVWGGGDVDRNNKTIRDNDDDDDDVTMIMVIVNLKVQ